MSRSGYSDDCSGLELGRWRGQVASAIRGERGQSFLAELIHALEAMSRKRLIKHDLYKDGEVCTLGAIGIIKGIDLESIDPEDHETLSDKFDIASQLVQEIEYLNDDEYNCESPEERWTRMYNWAKEQLKSSQNHVV